MKIDIADAIQNEGEVYTVTYDGTLESIKFSGESFCFADGIHVDANYHFDGEGVMVIGNFSTDVQVTCARCLKAFLYPVDVQFAEYYKKQPEDGMYTYDGDIIDLARMLQDNVVLNLPVRFLCKDDCKGLCSVCGKDLNEGECGCDKEIDKSNPFYGLSKLYSDEEV